MANSTAAQTGDQSLNNPEFLIQRIYVKDVSFESPNAPAIFKENLQPVINLNVQTLSEVLTAGVYEVTVSATVAAKVDDRTIFLIEVKQAGIFTINHIPAENIPLVLNVTCPTILFPYLREQVSELASRGGFSNFYLTPINFEALYLNNVEKQKEKNSVKNKIQETIH